MGWSTANSYLAFFFAGAILVFAPVADFVLGFLAVARGFVAFFATMSIFLRFR
jgi:hypothetical protein